MEFLRVFVSWCENGSKSIPTCYRSLTTESIFDASAFIRELLFDLSATEEPHNQALNALFSLNDDRSTQKVNSSPAWLFLPF